MNPVVRRAYFESFQQKEKSQGHQGKEEPSGSYLERVEGVSSDLRPRTLASSVVIAMRLLAATIIRAALTGLGARILILGFDV